MCLSRHQVQDLRLFRKGQFRVMCESNWLTSRLKVSAQETSFLMKFQRKWKCTNCVFVAAAYCIMVLKLYRKLLSVKQKKETDLVSNLSEKKNVAVFTSPVNKSNKLPPWTNQNRSPKWKIIWWCCAVINGLSGFLGTLCSLQLKKKLYVSLIMEKFDLMCFTFIKTISL